MFKILLTLVFIIVFSPITLTQESPSQISVTLENQGGNLEGHTPRGFQGQGTGLFIGDNLNPNFPNGDGVQAFLTFDISSLPKGKIISSTLKSKNAKISGRPFENLGNLNAQQVNYRRFSSSLWDLEPINFQVCVFADSKEGPFECDITPELNKALEENYDYLQLRLSFDEISNSDNKQDIVMFFKTNSNINEPGIFEIETKIVPDLIIEPKNKNTDNLPNTPILVGAITTIIIILFLFKFKNK